MTVTSWRPPGEQPEDASVLEELREGTRRVDWLAIAAVPALLVAILAVDPPARSLVLSHTAPTPASIVTTHFVHQSPTHLLENVAAYVLVVPTAYVLAVLADGRREFLAAFVGNLLLLPPVLSGLDLLVFDHGVTLGFSGVLMAFVGLLALQAGTFVEEQLVDDLEGDLAPALFFAGLAFVAATTISATVPRLALAGGAAVVAGFSLRGSLDRSRPVGRSIQWLRSDAGQLGAVGLFVLVVGLVVGFPDDPGTGTVVVNRFGHFAGFVLGFLWPYITFRVAGGRSRETDSPPEAV